jgi:hypothetical protein
MSEALHNKEPAQLPHSSVEQTGDQVTPAKRSPADDELQFISSNPIKKRRLTEQNPAQMASGSMSPPPPPRQQTPSQTTLGDRPRSLCDIGQTKATIPKPIPEIRGASLPVLEGFAFPQSFPVPTGQSSRLSEAISPKQLPQPFPVRCEAETNENQPPGLQPAATPAPQHSVTLDQISCLDFNGVPTNTPGFDMSHIFSSDGGILEALGMGMGTSAPPPALADAINPPSTHNAIPFTMYSTGNLMTMPPIHGGNQLPVPFASGPMQHHGVHSSGQMPNPHSRGQYPANSQVQPQSGNMVLNRSSSSAPRAKPHCLYCTRIRQEKLWRQVQASSVPASQKHSHHLPPPRVPAQAVPGPGPGPMPRSTPADGQPATVHNQYQHQHPHHQHHSTAQFLTPAVPSTPAARPSLAGPALLHDIAQTVQLLFPYAHVADRHGMVSAKVAEVVSNMVIKPLMRGANRPPGMG